MVQDFKLDRRCLRELGTIRWSNYLDSLSVFFDCDRRLGMFGTKKLGNVEISGIPALHRHNAYRDST